ncbi:patatin-like phospholipase family protein [Pseudoflavitalea sp. G-6-1-2]|uniref:patatin-like phospholipase family protein n=1 Tax=Pseudoflavitalea sp. G-6-1-2 TaxID=2728841 RepID=UPI00146E7B8E|nr:patatin-like phospholipase family protein [Pseudoflavitalea sp. G-6-1-2]NML23484.1 patatin-like phospholipase family protein [Pseudoflavitalea sp. G-6-1-2]
MNPVTSQPELIKVIDDCTPIEPHAPLQNIALTFSGGGFRAASFSLGVLSYLFRIQFQDKPLLEKVKFITSTSGGSITNGFYVSSLYLNPQHSFLEFYQQLRKEMEGEKLLQEAFSTLRNKKAWTENGSFKDASGNIHIVHKKRNLINAFAKSYDKILFNHATLGAIADAHRGANKPHLEKVCFNTTEFNNGINFYFQINTHQHFVYRNGNGYLKLSKSETAKKLKLSDVVAASSCFPSGFEPLLYPNDFVHENNRDLNELFEGLDFSHNNPLDLDDVNKKAFALMDGGICDNMGLRAVQLEDSRRLNANPTNGKAARNQPFDLILSCDVSSYFNNPYKEKNGSHGGILSFLTIQRLINVCKYANILLLACIASIVLKLAPVAGYLLLIPSLALSAVYWFGFVKLKRAAKKSGGSAAVAFKYLDYFLRLPLSKLMPMVKERLSSSLMLVSDLFLKQIRRAQYENLLSKPVMKNRAQVCLIYEFSSAHEARRLRNLEDRDKKWWDEMKETLMPSPAMQQLVDEARTMGTTLWFDESSKDKRDKVIASGQLTACYNLIKHIMRLETLHHRYKHDADLQKLKQELLHDWHRFQQDPCFMINNLTA